MKRIQSLTKLAANSKIMINEDYVSDIPDFVLEQIATEAVESLKSHIRRHINQSSLDATKQRKMLAAANSVLKELQLEIKDLLENKLMSFVQAI